MKRSCLWIPTPPERTTHKANNTGVMVNLTADANKGTGQGYGAAKKYYIRVWLEGEDFECWNANAGQDFTISLKFSKIGAEAVPTSP